MRADFATTLFALAGLVAAATQPLDGSLERRQGAGNPAAQPTSQPIPNNPPKPKPSAPAAGAPAAGAPAAGASSAAAPAASAAPAAGGNRGGAAAGAGAARAGNMPPVDLQMAKLAQPQPGQNSFAVARTGVGVSLVTMPGAMRGLGMMGVVMPAATNPYGCAPMYTANFDANSISPQMVSQAIQAYSNNVKQVSAFLESTAANPNDPGVGGNAITARNAENDETNHLNTMCSLGPKMLGQAVFNNSCNNLPNSFFPEVVADLQNIADANMNGPNPAVNTQLVNKMNANRCANVLPNIQNLWDASAQAMNVQSQQLIAPVACSDINRNTTQFSNGANSAGVFSTQLVTASPRTALFTKPPPIGGVPQPASVVMAANGPPFGTGSGQVPPQMAMGGAARNGQVGVAGISSGNAQALANSGMAPPNGMPNQGPLGQPGPFGTPGAVGTPGMLSQPNGGIGSNPPVGGTANGLQAPQTGSQAGLNPASSIGVDRRFERLARSLKV